MAKDDSKIVIGVKAEVKTDANDLEKLNQFYERTKTTVEKFTKSLENLATAIDIVKKKQAEAQAAPRPWSEALGKQDLASDKELKVEALPVPEPLSGREKVKGKGGRGGVGVRGKGTVSVPSDYAPSGIEKVMLDAYNKVSLEIASMAEDMIQKEATTKSPQLRTAFRLMRSYITKRSEILLEELNKAKTAFERGDKEAFTPLASRVGTFLQGLSFVREKAELLLSAKESEIPKMMKGILTELGTRTREGARISPDIPITTVKATKLAEIATALGYKDKPTEYPVTVGLKKLYPPEGENVTWRWAEKQVPISVASKLSSSGRRIGEIFEGYKSERVKELITPFKPEEKKWIGGDREPPTEGPRDWFTAKDWKDIRSQYIQWAVENRKVRIPKKATAQDVEELFYQDWTKFTSQFLPKQTEVGEKVLVSPEEETKRKKDIVKQEKLSAEARAKEAEFRKSPAEVTQAGKAAGRYYFELTYENAVKAGWNELATKLKYPKTKAGFGQFLQDALSRGVDLEGKKITVDRITSKELMPGYVKGTYKETKLDEFALAQASRGVKKESVAAKLRALYENAPWEATAAVGTELIKTGKKAGQAKGPLYVPGETEVRKISTVSEQYLKDKDFYNLLAQAKAPDARGKSVYDSLNKKMKETFDDWIKQFPSKITDSAKFAEVIAGKRAPDAAYVATEETKSRIDIAGSAKISSEALQKIEQDTTRVTVTETKKRKVARTEEAASAKSSSEEIVKSNQKIIQSEESGTKAKGKGKVVESKGAETPSLKPRYLGPESVKSGERRAGYVPPEHYEYEKEVAKAKELELKTVTSKRGDVYYGQTLADARRLKIQIERAKAIGDQRGVSKLLGYTEKDWGQYQEYIKEHPPKSEILQKTDQETTKTTVLESQEKKARVKKTAVQEGTTLDKQEQQSAKETAKVVVETEAQKTEAIKKTSRSKKEAVGTDTSFSGREKLKQALSTGDFKLLEAEALKHKTGASFAAAMGEKRGDPSGGWKALSIKSARDFWAQARRSEPSVKPVEEDYTKYGFVKELDEGEAAPASKKTRVRRKSSQDKVESVKKEVVADTELQQSEIKTGEVTETVAVKRGRAVKKAAQDKVEAVKAEMPISKIEGVTTPQKTDQETTKTTITETKKRRAARTEEATAAKSSSDEISKSNQKIVQSEETPTKAKGRGKGGVTTTPSITTTLATPAGAAGGLPPSGGDEPPEKPPKKPPKAKVVPAAVVAPPPEPIAKATEETNKLSAATEQNEQKSKRSTTQVRQLTQAYNDMAEALKALGTALVTMQTNANLVFGTVTSKLDQITKEIRDKKKPTTKEKDELDQVVTHDEYGKPMTLREVKRYSSAGKAFLSESPKDDESAIQAKELDDKFKDERAKMLDNLKKSNKYMLEERGRREDRARRRENLTLDPEAQWWLRGTGRGFGIRTQEDGLYGAMGASGMGGSYKFTDLLPEYQMQRVVSGLPRKPSVSGREQMGGMSTEMRGLMTAFYGQGERVSAAQLIKVGIDPKTAQEAQGKLKGMKEQLSDIGKAAKAAADSVDGGGRRMKDAFGQVEISLGGLWARMERLAYFQASWYATRALIFMPSQILQDVVGYQAAIDKAAAMIARYGALEGQAADIAKQAGVEVTTMARQIALVVPASFEQVITSADRLRAAGVSLETVRGSLEAFAKVQFTYPEVEMERFTNSVVGFVNTFRGGKELSGLANDAERYKAVLDKVTKALAVGVIQPRDITSVIQHLGQMSQAAGFSIDQMLALSVMITNMGAKANLGARALRGLMDSLQTEQGVKALARIGVFIDKDRSLADQFLDIIKQLQKALGEGKTEGFQFFASMFLRDIAPVERRGALQALIKELETYSNLEKSIRNSKGAVDTAAVAAAKNMAATWQLAKTAMLEVGTALGPTSEMLNTLSSLALDMARGLLFALNPALIETRVKFDELGSAGKTVYDVMIGIKGVFSAFWEVLGKGGLIIKPVIELLGSFKGVLPYAIEALMLFGGGKLLGKIGTKAFGGVEAAKEAKKLQGLKTSAIESGMDAYSASEYFDKRGAREISRWERIKIATADAYRGIVPAPEWPKITPLPAKQPLVPQGGGIGGLGVGRELGRVGAPFAYSQATGSYSVPFLAAREAATIQLEKAALQAKKATTAMTGFTAAVAAAKAGLTVLAKELAAFGVALITNPLTWLAVAIAVFVKVYQEEKEKVEKSNREMQRSVEELKSSIAGMSDVQWDLQVNKLKEEKEKALKELKELNDFIIPQSKMGESKGFLDKIVTFVKENTVWGGGAKHITWGEYAKARGQKEELVGPTKNWDWDWGLDHTAEREGRLGIITAKEEVLASRKIKEKAKPELPPEGVDRHLDKMMGAISQIVAAYMKMFQKIGDKASADMARIQNAVEMGLLDPMDALDQQLDVINKKYEDQLSILLEQRKVLFGETADLENISSILQGILTSSTPIKISSPLRGGGEEIDRIRESIKDMESSNAKGEAARYATEHEEKIGPKKGQIVAHGAYGFTPERWAGELTKFQKDFPDIYMPSHPGVATKEQQDLLMDFIIGKSQKAGYSPEEIARRHRSSESPTTQQEYAERFNKIYMGRVAKEVGEGTGKQTGAITTEHTTGLMETLAKGLGQNIVNLLNAIPLGSAARSILEQAIQDAYGKGGTEGVVRVISELFNMTEDQEKKLSQLVNSTGEERGKNEVQRFNLRRERILRDYEFEKNLTQEFANQDLVGTKQQLEEKATLKNRSFEAGRVSTKQMADFQEQQINDETDATVLAIKARWAAQEKYYDAQIKAAGEDSDKGKALIRDKTLEHIRVFGPNGEIATVQKQGAQKILEHQNKLLTDIRYLWEQFGTDKVVQKVVTDFVKEWSHMADRIAEITQGMVNTLQQTFATLFDDLLSGKTKKFTDYVDMYLAGFRKSLAESASKAVTGVIFGGTTTGTRKETGEGPAYLGEAWNWIKGLGKGEFPWSNWFGKKEEKSEGGVTILNDILDTMGMGEVTGNITGSLADSQAILKQTTDDLALSFMNFSTMLNNGMGIPSILGATGGGKSPLGKFTPWYNLAMQGMSLLGFKGGGTGGGTGMEPGYDMGSKYSYMDAELHKGGPIKVYHEGGELKDDEVVIKAQKGEFMQQKSAVAKYGVEFMKSINEGKYEPNMKIKWLGANDLNKIGKYHEGGEIGIPSASANTASSIIRQQSEPAVNFNVNIANNNNSKVTSKKPKFDATSKQWILGILIEDDMNRGPYYQYKKATGAK